MSVGELLLTSIQWSAYGTCAGPGTDELGPNLRRFINSTSSEDAREAWMTIENVAFAQNTIYAAAEPVVEVLLGALSDERPHWTRIWIIEMLRFILVAGSPDDPHLLDRCVERTRLAFWLLVEHARRDSDLDREAVLEVLGLVDADRARLVRAALR